MFDCFSWAFLALVTLHPITQEARPLDAGPEGMSQQMSSVDDWIKTQQQTFGTLGINPDWLKPSESEDFDLNSLVPTKEVWQCILETRKGVLYDGIGFER